MCHVLVIEDQWFIADHIVFVIAQAGATSIDLATTEADAVAAALARPPSVIMSDIRLAEGTGPAAVQTIIERLGPLPVIFVTGTPEECKPCDPPMVVLGKPIQDAVLKATFRELAPV